MSGAADVDPAAIGDLASALRRYVPEAERASAEARRCLDQVGQEVIAEISRRAGELTQAQSALQACRSDERNNCSGLELRVRRAQERLESARKAARMLDAGAATFSVAASRFDRVIGTLVRDCQDELKDALSEIAEYLATSTSDARASFGRGSRGPAGYAQAESGTHDRDDARSPLPKTPAGFPDDMHLIPVELIDDGPNPVNGPQDFSKDYSPADLEWGYRMLEERVMPAMAMGKGIDYFRERDAAENLMGTRSYEMTYAGFFQGDCPVISRKPDGRYTMDGNGRHRLWVARTYGFSAIPARVQ